MYVKIDGFDTSYIGKTVHFDFYNRSFISGKRDTLSIMVNNKTVGFVEHREDDGFNNWFSRQYLEEIKNNKNEHLRITKSVVKDVTKDSILVTSYFDLFDGKNNISGKSFTQDIWFEKKIITQILVQSEPCANKKIYA